MKKTTIRRKPIAIAVTVIYLVSAALVLPSLIRSGYIKVISPDFGMLVLAYYLLIMLVLCISGSLSSVLITTASASLAVGNVSQALLFYSCHMDADAASQMERLKMIVCLHFGGIAAAWCMLAILDWLVQKHPLTEYLLCTALCSLVIGLILLRSGRDANTSTIAGIQPAIVTAFLILICYAVSLGRQFPVSRLMHFLLCFGMAGSLILKHEWGIPILCTLSCLIFYLLIYPTPRRLTLLIYTLTALLFCAAALTFKEELLADTLKKLHERTQDNAQIRSVFRTIQTSGIFGRFSYDVKVPAASTDFALATSIHFAGFLWLGVTALTLCAGWAGLIREESSAHGFAPSVLFRGLSGIAFIVFIGYNLAMSLSLVPLIGVQSLFCGSSYSMALLSSMLLGSLTYQADGIRHIRERAASCLAKLY